MLLAQAILVALKSYGFGATTFLGEACIKIVPTSQNHAYSEDRFRLLARLKPILCNVKQKVRAFQ
jgi:hypothetical protein